MIRICKEFSFEMAHVLNGHDGKCSNIHGHSYQLSVMIKGNPIKDENSPKNGMVIDFAELKAIVESNIIHPFDHALVLNEKTTYKDDLIDLLPRNNVLLVPYQPTSENLIGDFAERIRKHLPAHVYLQQLTLRETPTSYVEWNASDYETP